VRAKYNALAQQDADDGDSACCGGASCGDDSLDDAGADFDMSDDYADTDLAADADLNLGCGLPTEAAALSPGEHVLDLGSGAGMDAFVARRAVGPEGHVHGVDFAPQMVAKARANADKLEVDNVTFQEGDIEDLPVAAGRFDVALSNCVLNLVPDKPAAFAEMYRVLRLGGRFVVSDIVVDGTLPDGLREDAALYVGCVAGAIDRTAYLDGLRAAGFDAVQVPTEKPIDLPDALLQKHLSAADAEEFRQRDGGLQSITVTGTKPEA
jgi:SAM-dependent methyltransferase